MTSTAIDPVAEAAPLAAELRVDAAERDLAAGRQSCSGIEFARVVC